MACSRIKSICISLGHALLNMRITGGHLRVSLPKRLLYDAEIFCYSIQIRAAAVPENVAADSLRFIVCQAQRLVHDGTDTVTRDPLMIFAV